MHAPSTPKLAPSLILSLFSLVPAACVDEEADLFEDAEAIEAIEAVEFRTTGSELEANDVCPNVINDGIGLMRYCRNRSIYSDNSNVERAIIVIHGSGLDAKAYYDKTVAEAVAEGVDMSKTDVIAPQFFETDYPLDGARTRVGVPPPDFGRRALVVLALHQWPRGVLLRLWLSTKSRPCA